MYITTKPRTVLWLSPLIKGALPFARMTTQLYMPYSPIFFIDPQEIYLINQEHAITLISPSPYARYVVDHSSDDGDCLW